MRKLSRIFIILIFPGFFLMFDIQAQEKRENVFLHPQKFYKKFFPKLKKAPNPLDTSYIKTYPNYLCIGAHVLLPKIYANLNPVGIKSEGQGASSKFRTNINTILSFSGS